MKILVSPSTDPLQNFALERELLTGRTGDFLLLYINAPAVVIGRNQAPAAEADLDYCRREGIAVIRRISGGGAVYHDAGNVNFAFITARTDRSILDERPLQPIVDALATMGVALSIGKRGELLTSDGLKVSGSASYVAAGRQLFHGTLLFDTDPERMRLALAGDPALRGSRVASTPSPTTNLKPLLGRFDTALEFMKTLATALERQDSNYY